MRDAQDLFLLTADNAASCAAAECTSCYAIGDSDGKLGDADTHTQLAVQSGVQLVGQNARTICERRYNVKLYDTRV